MALLANPCGSAWAASSPNRLDCSSNDEFAQEAQVIQRLAAGIVERHSHTLTVKTHAGPLKFEDLPPFDEPFVPQRFRFCDRKNGYILLNKAEDTLFTGVLINESTGHVGKGGERVILSPDLRAYFAEEQPDGLDGSIWKIYFADGRESWSGYSFIRDPANPNRAIANLWQPEFNTHGELIAKAACSTGKPQWQATLRKIDGEWDWYPRKKCPAEPS
jgi:hypothetical protein